MKAIIFDTETNGKILKFGWKLSKVNLEYSRTLTLGNFPRITQIAWQVVDMESTKVLKEFQSIIKPDGWEVPKEKFFIDNNMSTERCEREGKEIWPILNELKSDMNECDILVAHNMNFDIPVVQCEMIRYGIKGIKPLVKVCTMLESTQYCKISNDKGGYKWPKLEELYRILFQKDFEGAHDAMYDVSATRECFIQLVKLSVIQTGK